MLGLHQASNLFVSGGSKVDFFMFFPPLRSDIMKLTERTQKVIEENGQYIIDYCSLFVLVNLLWKSWKKRNNFVANPIDIYDDLGNSFFPKGLTLENRTKVAGLRFAAFSIPNGNNLYTREKSFEIFQNSRPRSCSSSRQVAYKNF